MEVILTSAFGVQADTQSSTGDEYTKHAEACFERNPVAGLASTLVSVHAKSSIQIWNLSSVCPSPAPSLPFCTPLVFPHTAGHVSALYFPSTFFRLPLISLLHYPPLHIHSATREFTSLLVCCFVLAIRSDFPIPGSTAALDNPPWIRRKQT